MDCGTLINRRASKGPIDKGGWNSLSHLDRRSRPVVAGRERPLRSNGDKAGFGWPKDEKLEALINDWFKAPDLARRKRWRRKSRSKFTRTTSPISRPGSSCCRPPYRKHLSGVIIAPVAFLWAVEAKFLARHGYRVSLAATATR
jgi:peptide/nickel transport system substrate-binding protein